MSPQIAVRLSPEEWAAVDAVVAKGRCPSRAAVIRESLALFLREEREKEIVESYRRGYAEHPDTEEWVGELGIALLAEFDAENPEPEPL